MRSAFFLCFTYTTNILNTFIITSNNVRFLLATHCSNAKRQPLIRFFYSLKPLFIKNEIKLPFHESLYAWQSSVQTCIAIILCKLL